MRERALVEVNWLMLILLVFNEFGTLGKVFFEHVFSLNEHLNKLREFQDWGEKANALSQWLEITDRKLDCCSELSEDPEEQEKQRIFLQVTDSQTCTHESSACILAVYKFSFVIKTRKFILAKLLICHTSSNHQL